MSDYLIHYGVKGMKWGVRRKSQSKGSTKSPKDRVTDKWNSLSPRTKTAIKVGAAAAGVALAAYGGHRYRKFVNDKATTVAVAKGKAIFEKVSATGWGNTKSFAMSRAGSQANEHVSRVASANIINQRSEIKDFNNVRKRLKRGEQVSDLDRAWDYYMRHPDRGATIVVGKRKRG